MHRRHFLTSLALTFPALSATAALGDGPDGIQPGAYYPVRVLGAGQSTRIDHVIVTDGRQALSINWRSGAALYDEDRIDLSGVGGGIGALFRTPFRSRWRQALPLGTVEIDRGRNTLIARVEDAAPLLGAAATVAAGHFSWDLPGRLAPGGAPAAGGEPAGALRIEEDGRLLVSLPQMVAQV